MFRRATGVLAASGGACTAALAALAASDQGFSRSLTFWRKAFPIYAHYRWTEWLFDGKPEKEYNEALLKLHQKYADDVLGIILEMRGFYVKIGQMGSQRDDFVHEEYLKRLRTLQHRVPPRPISFVKELICSELNVASASEVFSHINSEPLGSASIGQVHEAFLASTGEQVCIKLQYPNVEAEFAWDMATIKAFVKLAVPAHSPYFEEIERQFASEFDYRREADQLALVRSQVLPRFGDRIQIPKPYRELCTKRLLTMEMLKGKVLVDAVRERAEALASFAGRGFSKGDDAHEGLTSDEYEAIERMLKWREMSLTVRRLAWNWTVGWIPGVTTIASSPRILPPVNIPKALDLLWEVHAFEMLISGALNGDPHPGNMLLCDDGKIGLIDYGQVKEIAKETRVSIARLCIALLNDDEAEIVRIQREEIGLKTLRDDPYVLYKHARLAWDNSGRETCEGKNVQLFVEDLDRRDPIVVSPDEYVLPVRMCMMLWGLSYHLKYDERVCKKLEKTAWELLEREDPCYLSKYDQ